VEPCGSYHGGAETQARFDITSSREECTDLVCGGASDIPDRARIVLRRIFRARQPVQSSTRVVTGFG